MRKTLEKNDVKDDSKSKNSNTKTTADEPGSRPEPGPAEGAADDGAENRVEKSLIDIYFDKLELVKQRYTGKNKAGPKSFKKFNNERYATTVSDQI